MNAYLDQSAVTLNIALNDPDGNALSVSAIEYRIVDQNDAELLPKTALASFVANAATATIQVDAAINTLPVGDLSGLRAVELYCTTANGVVLVRDMYGLQPISALIGWKNSYQTYGNAMMLAMQMPDVDQFMAATEQQRISALIRAYDNIGKMTYTVPVYTEGMAQQLYPQDYDTTNPYWNLDSTYVIRDVNHLTAAELGMLPMVFLDALKKAQVAEADAILGGDPIDAKRRDGLMSESIGESSNMFRPGKPLITAISRKAMAYLRNYVQYARRIGR